MKDNQIEKQQFYTLLTSPDLTKQCLPVIKAEVWTCEAYQWLWNKMREHYALHGNIPTIPILCDYTKSISNNNVLTEALNNVLTEAPNQCQQDNQYFKEQLLQTAKLNNIKQVLLKCGEMVGKDGNTDIDGIIAELNQARGNVVSLPTPIDVDTLSMLPSDDRQCLLNDWAFERGEVIGINAPTGIGKSVLAYQLATHWSVGKECVGMKPNNALRVMLIQNEDTLRTMAVQHAGATQYFTESERALSKQNFLPIRLRGKSGKEFLALLAAYLQAYSPDIVILNPLSKYFGDDEISGKAVADFFNGIEPLLDKHNCGMLLFSHTKKQSKEQKKDALDDLYNQYGSSKWGDFIRETLNIKITDNDLYYHLWASRKRRNQWGWDKQIIKQAEKGQLPYWSVCDESEVPVEALRGKSKNNLTRDECLLAIPVAPNNASKDEIASRIGKTTRTVQDYLNEFLSQGRIIKCQVAEDTTDTLRIGRPEIKYQRVSSTNN